MAAENREMQIGDDAVVLRQNNSTRKRMAVDQEEQLPAALAIPATPPTALLIDTNIINALAASIAHALQQHPTMQQLLQPPEPKKQCNVEVITLDDDDDEVAAKKDHEVLLPQPQADTADNLQETSSLIAPAAAPSADDDAERSSEDVSDHFMAADQAVAAFIGSLTAEKKKQFAELFHAKKLERNELAASAPVAGQTLRQLLDQTIGLPSDAIPKESQENGDNSIHSNFLRGTVYSKACPKCAKSVGRSCSSRRDHYLQFHYDVYYSFTRKPNAMETWIGTKMGYKPLKANGKQKYYIEQLEKRICLHCKTNGSMSDEFHKGRIGLLKHIELVHPEEFNIMQTEYREFLPMEVKDADVHEMLKSNDRTLRRRN